MPFVPTPRSGYSRAEFISDAVVHVAGLALVLMAIPVLIVVTAMLRGDTSSIVGVSIYGAAMLAMIACSALYNMTPGTALAWLYRRLDHSAIYVKIAGTYTPFTLISGQGFTLTAGVWAAAALGVALKIVAPERFRWLALSLYLGMGWAGLVAGQALIAVLPMPVLVLMVIGGLLYSGGVVFYLWERLPFHTTIWHVFVLAATFVFYAAVVTLVVLGRT
ncbi:hemolysin III family protein [Pararhodobacter sp. SW119]|uniref:PAQR family membrane homeostasis protein TrhA n=1 Tax=Pararhodobacter sp. SW119 TaxID=2780075 RepID=UPI001ADF42B9|nr:hemolysin III family protein [Pararhodobacter sp. SW119]